MANLRGGNFQKQVKDAFFKVLRLGTSRHLKQDNYTHSAAVADKRKTYLNDFSNFLKQKGICTGKINQHMTEENVKNFLEERTLELHPKSSLDYVSGFNSLMKGLQQAKINIPSDPINRDFLKDYRETFREEMKQIEVINNRYIQDADEKLDKLRDIRFESYVIGKLQLTTGLRVNEAREVVQNFDTYYNPQSSKLVGIIGKGNHEYDPKPINYKLALEIQKITNVPHYNTYRQDLQKIGIDRSHNFRVTYAKNSLQNKIEQGVSYKKALIEVSKEINHHRPEMTEYYLNRA